MRGVSQARKDQVWETGMRAQCAWIDEIMFYPEPNLFSRGAACWLR